MPDTARIDTAADKVLTATLDELAQRRPGSRLIVGLELELRREVMALLADSATEPLMWHALAVRWGAMLKAGHRVDQFGLWTRTTEEIDENSAPFLLWETSNVAGEAERGAPHLVDLKRPHDVAHLVPAPAPRAG